VIADIRINGVSYEGDIQRPISEYPRSPEHFAQGFESIGTHVRRSALSEESAEPYSLNFANYSDQIEVTS
jgi:hypothetical protein